MTENLPTEPVFAPAPPASGQPPAPSPYSPVALAALMLIAAWAFCSVWVVHSLGWLIVDESLALSGVDVPTYVWPLLVWGLALLVALVAVPGAVFIREPRARGGAQALALATAYGAWLGLMRFLPVLADQEAAIAQIVLSCVAGLVVVGVARWRKRGAFGVAVGSIWLAVAVAGLALMPFAWWGALGSLSDTGLSLLAGLSGGLFAGAVLDVFVCRPWLVSGRLGDFLLGSVVAGAVLTLIAAGFGFNGSQLLLLLVVPPLGLMVMGLGRVAAPDRAWLPIAVLVGLALAIPVMFVDPEEITFILGDHDILQWASWAAYAALAFAGGLSLVGGLLCWWKPKIFGAWPVGLGATMLMALISSVTYVVVGQPGFYGDHVFVILADQADLSAAPGLADRTERLTYVYQTLTDHARTTQAPILETLTALQIQHQSYYLVNAIEVNGGLLTRLWLSTQPGVARVIDSPHLRPLPEPVPMSTGDLGAPPDLQWNLTSIGADRVWREFGATGEGIIVGQSDSGVDGTHPAIKDQYRGLNEGDDYNWLDPWNNTPSPTDIGGHGTHTLGTILGEGVGVAPGAQWFGCVNLARNLGNPAVYLNCMEFMLAPWPQAGDPLTDGDPSRAAHVINNSWGCPPLEGCDPTSLQAGVAALRAAGIFVVASAGNDGQLVGCGSVKSPIALYDEAFSVGAVDESGDLASFSSRGPVTVDGSNRMKPDIAAPGVAVWSSSPGGTYAQHDGTSMAGPHVVGAVALLWSAAPALIGDIDRTEQILRDTAQPYTGVVSAHGACDDLPLPNNGVGAGLLDVYAAVKMAVAGK